MSLYLEHFGLRELPFRITPAVDYFFRGTARGAILDALKYALGNGEGILAVFGEVGSGKSMLCRRLMADLADSCELVYVANPTLSGREILFHIAEELGLDVGGERHQVASMLQAHLLELHASSRRIIVCIDEAQAMPDESLEQIRLISNLETSKEKIVQIVLFGQPELQAKLKQQHMRQLRERITSTFTLQSFGPDEVRAYIESRLHSGGYERKEPLFAPAAAAAIAKVSQGILRRINILCDKSLLAAFAEGATSIQPRHAAQAARDARYQRMAAGTFAESGWRSSLPPIPRLQRVSTLVAGVLVVLAFAATGLQFWPAGGRGASAAVAQSAQPDEATQSEGASTPPAAAAASEGATPAPDTPASPPASAPENESASPLSAAQPAALQAEQNPEQEPAPTEARPIASAQAVALDRADASQPAAESPAAAARPIERAQPVARNQQAGNIQPAASPPPAADAASSTASRERTLPRIELVNNPRWHSYPKASYLRQQLNTTQTLLGLLEDPNLYTARILTAPRGRAVDIEKYLRDLARFYAIQRVMIYPSQAEGQDNFVITYGQYRSEFEAELFIQELPSFFRGNRPYVQAMAVSQLESFSHW